MARRRPKSTYLIWWRNEDLEDFLISWKYFKVELPDLTEVVKDFGSPKRCASREGCHLMAIADLFDARAIEFKLKYNDMGIIFERLPEGHPLRTG